MSAVVKINWNTSLDFHFEPYGNSNMRRFIYLATVLFSAMGTSFGQARLTFDFGLRTGIPTTTLLESNFTAIPGLSTFQQSFKRPSFTVGPTFAAVLYDRVIVELDALYKPVRFTRNETTPSAIISNRSRGAFWEFPLVFDYRFLHGTLRPYAGGGGVLGQTMAVVTESQTAFFNSGRIDHTFGQFGGFDSQLPAYVVNAGVEWNKVHVVVRPELRYTRWDNTASDPKIKRDQVECLVGLSFR
jgi:hypothetical protein